MAAHVAARARSTGVTVWWVSAASTTDLNAGLREVAAHLGADEEELTQAWAGQASAVELLWRSLRSFSGRWLLVIDNADEPAMLAAANGAVSEGRGWLRPLISRRGAIIVTSRDGNPETWDRWCHRQPVGMLAGRDGALVLLDRAGHLAGTASEAAALSDRLGGLALARTPLAAKNGCLRHVGSLRQSWPSETATPRPNPSYVPYSKPSVLTSMVNSKKTVTSG
jgi:hypothetical protein